MKNAILLHGLQSRTEYYDPSYPAPGNAHWFPWLQKQLLIKDIYAETPTVPKLYKATYEDWKNTFERCAQLNEDTLLVGHSCGGGFIIRWLSENQEATVGKVVLVAPWLDPTDDPNYMMGDFFDFTIDPELTKRTDGITIFFSEDDYLSILESVKMIETNIGGVKINKFIDKGHFCFDDLKTEEFPELLEEILS